MHSKDRLFQLFPRILKLLFWIIFAGISLFSLSSCVGKKQSFQPVKVGILYSRTGLMAVEEKPIIDAILMAIEEINANGGLLGHRLEPIVYDAASNIENYAKGALELIEKEKVVVIFGGGNSVSRRNIRAIIEENEGLLVYPMHYEGGKHSSRIIYVGAAPNQQLIPGVEWAFRNIGSRFFLLGTDSIYSHVANVIIKDFIYALNGEVIGEAYISVDNTFGLDSIVERINSSHPDVVLNTIEGPGNVDFFKSLRQIEAHTSHIPIMSFGLTENLLKHLSGTSLEGDYAVWSYFQNINNKRSQEFESAFYAKYGKGRAIDDPMVSGYAGVYLWAKAVKDAKSFNPDLVLKSIANQSFIAPSGLIYMDPETQSAYRPVRIGVIQSDNQFKVLWDSETSVMPVQYTPFKTPQDWDELIEGLFEKWGRQWFRGKE